MQDKSVDFNEFLYHFPCEVTEGMANFANEEVFKFSRYIFTRREGKQQYGYCTHCKKGFKTAGLRHNEKSICPKCKSECKVKASGYGRSVLIDTAYFVYYEKSVINPKAIVANGIYAVRDYRFDYRKVETKFITKSLYLFELGGCKSYRRYTYYSYQYDICKAGEWEKCKTIYSEANQDSMVNMPCFYSRDSIKQAVKGTSFAWSGWEAYQHEDMLKFFGLYAKYPAVEYLTKLGFTGLVEEKLQGNRTYGAINWHGKNLFKVLKLTKNELSEIKANKIDIAFFELKLLQVSKKDGTNFTISEACEICRKYDYYIDEIEKSQRYCQLKKLINYLDKQYLKDDKQYYTQGYVLSTWKDYIADCVKLDMDLTKESTLFPKNLFKAHQNTIKQIKIKADEILNKEIKSRLKSLNKKYYFEYQGMMIRPAESSIELINEGKALNHCVGTYAKQYASGQIVILFIRNISKPQESFYTVEIRKDTVIQIRGKRNCAPDQKVEAFMEAFKAEKLKKEAKTKINVPA